MDNTVGGAYKVLPIEGLVLKGVDVGDVRLQQKYEYGIIPIIAVGAEYGILMGGVWVAVQ
jgi:hypothetical protein